MFKFKPKTLVVIYKQETEGCWSTEYVGDVSLKESLKNKYLEEALLEVLNKA